MLQTLVNQLSQQPHAVINLSLALLLVLSAWYLIGRNKIPCTAMHYEPLSQLEVEVKKQADLIVNLQSAALANSRAHNELVQHFQHLRAHVRRNNKSQQLLQDLSGVLEDLRAQLKASMVSHETMQSQSAALAELQHQTHTMAKLQQELMTQAQVIGSLKTQIGASAEQHRQLICQVDALGDIRAQLSDSLELQQQLQSRATSLEETQALVAEELKTQKALSLRQATLESAIAGASVRAGFRGGAGLPPHAAPSGLMNRVFHRRSSGASAGSSISFLSEWFEHSFRASQGSAPDPALQLPNPNPSDLEATKLADSVNSVNPMLWASKQDGLVSPFSLHQPPASIFDDRGLIASSGPGHACSSPPMPHIPALRFQQKASRLRRCASTGMYEAVSAYAAADTMEESSSLGRGSSGSQGHVSRAVSSRGDFINNIYCDMDRPVARFVSPFAFQPAGSLHHRNPAIPEGAPPPAPRPPLIRPTTHMQMVHRLSREFQNIEPPSMPSMPAGDRAVEPSEEGVGNTQAVSFSLGSQAGPTWHNSHAAKQAATSAWDQLLRCQSLEPPTASQLSVTRTQQAMTLMDRTESIRDRTSSK